jgi:hypothetical protein
VRSASPRTAVGCDEGTVARTSPRSRRADVGNAVSRQLFFHRREFLVAEQLTKSWHETAAGRTLLKRPCRDRTYKTRKSATAHGFVLVRSARGGQPRERLERRRSLHRIYETYKTVNLLSRPNRGAHPQRDGIDGDAVPAAESRAKDRTPGALAVARLLGRSPSLSPRPSHPPTAAAPCPQKSSSRSLAGRAEQGHVVFSAEREYFERRRSGNGGTSSLLC